MRCMNRNVNSGEETEWRHRQIREQKRTEAAVTLMWRWRRNKELTVMMSRILRRLWTLSPGSTSFTTGSVPSFKKKKEEGDTKLWKDTTNSLYSKFTVKTYTICCTFKTSSGIRGGLQKVAMTGRGKLTKYGVGCHSWFGLINRSKHQTGNHNLNKEKGVKSHHISCMSCVLNQQHAIV